MLEKESDKLRDDLRDTFEALLLALLMLDFGDLSVFNKINSTVDRWSSKYIIPIFEEMGVVTSGIVKDVNDYFKSLGLNPLDRKTNMVLKRLGLKGVTEGTYLESVAKLSPVKSKIKGYVLTSFSAGKSREDFTKGLKQLFDNNGMVDKYFNTYAYDLFSQTQRMISDIKAKELGLDKFIYAGTIIETTRDFCADRVGNLYTIEEAQEWNDLEWRGKIEGVDVLIQLGGYNCRHYKRYTT